MHSHYFWVHPYKTTDFELILKLFMLMLSINNFPNQSQLQTTKFSTPKKLENQTFLVARSTLVVLKMWKLQIKISAS